MICGVSFSELLTVFVSLCCVEAVIIETYAAEGDAFDGEKSAEILEFFDGC